MPRFSTDFFQRFALCFDAFDPEQASEFYHLPAVIMNDTDKYVFSRQDELVARIDTLMQSLKQVGVVNHQVEVSQTMRLSDNILFSNVKWRFYDAQQDKVFSCVTSYTLQRDESDKLKIIVAVIDDEEKQLAEMLNN